MLNAKAKTGARRARDVVFVLAAMWAVRLAFMFLVPAGARSIDAFSWETVAGELAAGENPYHTTSLLNWPPMWVSVVFCLSKVAGVLDAPFFRVLQLFLILVESAVVVFLVGLLQRVVPGARVRRLLLWGIALNPVPVLLVCQHCNFDVLVALWLVLFVTCLLRYNSDGTPADWLRACLFLGLGIFTKTVPLVLIPLLAGGFRRGSGPVRFLGSLLLLGPVTVGMGILYALAPADVVSKVLLYRSQEGFFGFHGLMCLAGFARYLGAYNALFYLLLIVVMGLSCRLFWQRQDIGPRNTVLYAALLLAAIPSLGPGYATQYVYWFLPFLLASFPAYGRTWRFVLAAWGLVSACTYVVEYGLFPEYGSSLFYLWPASLSSGAMGDALVSAYYRFDSELCRTLLRVPIFLACLALLLFGGRMLMGALAKPAREPAETRFFTSAIYVPLTVVVGLTVLAWGIWWQAAPGNGRDPNASSVEMDPASNQRWATKCLNNLAWKLATSPDAAARNVPLAVKAAERACRETGYRETVMVGTLAAAYAAAGRFDDAVSTAEKACGLAAERGDTELLRVNRELLEKYRNR